MRRLAWTFAALAISASSGCQRETPPQPRAARHLVLGQVASAVTLDPHGHDQTYTGVALSHFYEALVAMGPELDLRPALALRWENPSDTVWRFHLRPGVVFHDGRPFGAEDVAASLRRALLPSSHVRYYIQAVRVVRVVDEATVDLITWDPAPVLLNRLAFVSIVPRDTGPEPIVQPVGTGPYRFVGGRPGAAIAGERFDRYWGRAPAFAQVTILPLPDARERAEAVALGRADVVSYYPAQYWEQGLRQPDVQMLSRQGLVGVHVSFSQKPGSPFADVRVRRAFAMGLDRDRIVRDALHNLGAPLDQVVPPSVVGYSAGLPPLSYDREAAQRLLREAGVAPGFQAELVTADTHADVAAEVARQLAEIGLKVRSKVLPSTEFYELWSREEIPLALMGWAPSTGDASGSFDPLLHSPKEGYGRFNRISYSNPRLDQLIEMSDQAQRPNDRRELLAAAAQIVRDEIPLLPLVLRHDLYASRKDLEWRPRLDRRVRAFEVQPAGAAASR